MVNYVLIAYMLAGTCFLKENPIMQKILVPIIVFCVVLIALTFGEGVFRGFAALVEEWTGIVLYNLSDFFNSI